MIRPRSHLSGVEKTLRSGASRVAGWVDFTLGYSAYSGILNVLNPMNSLGGLAFLFFTINAATGIMLAVSYTPTSDAAYNSVQIISTTLRYGWLIRGIHFYTANGMIIAAILHLVNGYFKGTYKKPQQLNWIVGVAAGALTVMAGFTGYVLRWDQEAVGAAGIGQGLAGSVPEFGAVLTSVFWGRNYTETLGRFYAAHVLIVPGLLVALLAVHFFVIRKHGIEILLEEINVAPVVIGLLFIFVSLFPLKLGESYNPMSPPTILEPEWYFMGMYQLLKTQSVEPLYGMLLATGLGLFLAGVPFLDRNPERRAFRRPAITAIGTFVMIEFLALTTYAYLSPGQVGTFSDSNFTMAFVLTNAIAMCAIAFVFAANRRLAKAKPLSEQRGAAA
jgi:ubiquinol-cytochrome c reductase cytochrome b subunit